MVKVKSGDIVARIIIGNYDPWHEGFPGGWLLIPTLTFPVNVIAVIRQKFVFLKAVGSVHFMGGVDKKKVSLLKVLKL